MRFKKALLCIAAVVVWAGSVSAATDPVSNWNAIVSQAALAAGQSPPVTSRTLAIVQVTVHDALNAIDSRYERYAFTGTAPTGASVDAAVAAAARNAAIGAIAVGTLPFTGFGTKAQQDAAVAQIEAQYQAIITSIPDGVSKSDGIDIGTAAAAAVMGQRNADHATDFVPYVPGTNVGDWQPTPNPVPSNPPAPVDHLPALLPGWGHVTPFVLSRSTNFGPAGPPKLSGPTYARDYNEIQAIGVLNSTTRTLDQSDIAKFWYEASALTWSRIGRIVAESQGLDSWETARLLALVSVAIADGYIGGFETKYELNFWRPVTAIRGGDMDGNDRTAGDPSWSSFLNTPAIPDYTSTHSVAGGAAAAIMCRFFRTDNLAFTLLSGPPFTGKTRSFSGFSQAAAENGESRIYAGIHFRTAVEDGIKQGNQIGNFVFTHALRAVPPEDDTVCE
jgi:hypothetical protein